MIPSDEPWPARRPFRRQFPFVRRLINPIKITEVVLFAADEAVRRAAGTARAEMPWARVSIASSPSALADIRSSHGTALLLDDAAMNVAEIEAVRRRDPRAVVVLLSAHPLVQCSPPSVARTQFPYTAKADLVFAVDRAECAPERVITAVVRAAEDYVNIRARPDVRRFIFLIVDDEPRWFSRFLPALYAIIGQRADVELARTYEAAVGFLFGAEQEPAICEAGQARGYGDDVVCLITDIYFPKGDSVDADAGLDLVRLVRRRLARIPIIIASKARQLPDLEGAGLVLPKGDPGSLELLKRYIRDVTGIGDFVIQDERGAELCRVRNTREMYRLFGEAEGGTAGARALGARISAHLRADRFSTWFHMHGLRDLAERVRPERLGVDRVVTRLRRELRREMLRMERTPLIIDGLRIFDLSQLAAALRTISPEKIQPFYDADSISSWLDQRGYSELADQLRPIHGKGAELGPAVADLVERYVECGGGS